MKKKIYCLFYHENFYNRLSVWNVKNIGIIGDQ